MDLESQVRNFVAAWQHKERLALEQGLPADPDSEDDEIVFVGRNGAMHDLHSPSSDTHALQQPPAKKHLMLFDTPEHDGGGTFARWLVHHIGVYYGLPTWSVTVGNPARRESYIGVKSPTYAPATHATRANDATTVSTPTATATKLPRPLYGLV